MEMTHKIVTIPGRGKFTAIDCKPEDGCNGCVAHHDRNLCMSLPSCCGPERDQVFIEVTDGNETRLTTAHPPEDPPATWATDVVRRCLQPSPVSAPTPAGLATPPHGGYVGPMEVTPREVERRLLGSLAATSAGVAAQVRTTDPQTSKDAAAKVGGGKLIDLILTIMQQEAGNEAGLGWTGKELAQATARPLNSITPRFAQLTRMGLIHAAGKRDKQIVWKLGNGVQV